MTPTSSRARVIVLGARGFIGRHVLRALQAAPDFEVVALGTAECRLTDPRAVQQVIRPLADGAHLVMCASVLRVDGEPARIFDDNVAMVRHLVESLHGLSPLSFSFLSSADVYGHPAAGQVLTEASPLHPQGYYGLSKVVCEQLLGLGLTCPLAVLRLPGVYGQGDHGRSVIGQFSRRILAGDTLTLVDGGRPRRDYVMAGDVAKVVLAQLRRRASLTLNLATGRSLSLLELVERIAAASGRPARIEFQETASPQYDLVFDRSALTNAFADLDMTSMPRGIDDYVSLLRKGSAPAG